MLTIFFLWEDFNYLSKRLIKSVEIVISGHARTHAREGKELLFVLIPLAAVFGTVTGARLVIGTEEFGARESTMPGQDQVAFYCLVEMGTANCCRYFTRSSIENTSHTSSPLFSLCHSHAERFHCWHFSRRIFVVAPAIVVVMATGQKPLLAHFRGVAYGNFQLPIDIAANVYSFFSLTYFCFDFY